MPPQQATQPTFIKYKHKNLKVKNYNQPSKLVFFLTQISKYKALVLIYILIPPAHFDK